MVVTQRFNGEWGFWRAISAKVCSTLAKAQSEKEKRELELEKKKYIDCYKVVIVKGIIADDIIYGEWNEEGHLKAV